MNGGEALDALRKGHMVRRKTWVPNFYIRITNESGYDEDGNAVFDELSDHIYTIATDGYFMHLGHSAQPIDGEGWTPRTGEGLNALFADDWEDLGFISREEFDKLTAVLQSKIRDWRTKRYSQYIERIQG